MPSYLVTGVSRGIGFGFLKHLAQEPSNLVIGLVRDKPTTEGKIASELGKLDNVHILQAELTNYKDLERSAAEAAKITGGSLDYLIANAGLISMFSGLDTFGELKGQPQELEADMIEQFKVNVIGQVHLFNAYLPLILKGKEKKVIAISSGNADNKFTARYDLALGGPYSASKAALNTIVSKYSAEYSEKGVLFLSVCPGMVDSGLNPPVEKLPKLEAMMGKFIQYSPTFKGPSTVEDSVRAVMKVVYDANFEAGHGGAFLSHFGNEKWV